MVNWLIPEPTILKFTRSSPNRRILHPGVDGPGGSANGWDLYRL